MLSEQLDREFTDAEYDDLKKVCSIWICMNAPTHIGNAMTEYRISRRNIPLAGYLRGKRAMISFRWS